MIDSELIEEILAAKLPPHVLCEDEDVKNYLIQMLQDDDALQDIESLSCNVSAFLGDKDNAEALAMEIIQAVINLASNGQQNSPSMEKAVSLQAPARLGEQPDKIQDRSTIGSQDDIYDEVPALMEEVPPGSPLQGEQSSKKSPARGGKSRISKKKTKLRPKEATEVSLAASTDDFSSAWQACREEGLTWGGRGMGGRGEYAGAVNSVKSNIHLSNVSVSLANGTELLHNATMDIVKGHRYGLIGRNGCGKSTLLRRLADKAIPGMPHDMRILLVQQQIDGSDANNAVETLIQADIDRTFLLQEQEKAEEKLASEDISEEELAAAAQRLGDIAAELEAIGADAAEERAVEILKGLQFTEAMMYGPTSSLSGGWRMRLSLARALFVHSDLLLFDECTNHLDLYGLDWLVTYLNQNTDRTLIVVSHDRTFLDAICTDIMVMSHQALKYHAGSYSDYERQQSEKSTREAQILDAAERQQKKAQAFIQKQQAMANKKSADPNKLRQAKMMKEKKLDRIGNYREDGKRYKLNSLKKLDESYVRLAQKVQIEVDDPIIKMYFPNPTWPPSILPGSPIIELEDFEFGYTAERTILREISLNLARGSKAALVGRNGCGKSTLAKLIAGDVDPSKFRSKGRLWIHPSVKIGHVTQYSVEELEAHASKTVVEYAEEILRTGQASSEVLAKASGNVRQYLGAFGLGGRQALSRIGNLSGGERMRLCFATVMKDSPHLLLLDESTNHVDIETLDSMSAALNAFEGSLLMVSHNQGFLSRFCRELWILENGQITVNHSDTETFDEIFSEYRNSVTHSGTSLSSQRRERAGLAKKATKQKAGARQNTALL